jgi:heme-degrading monooxygenase HmoA
MFVVHNRIDVPAENTDRFEQFFGERMRTTLGGVPGLLRSTLMRPSEPGQPYVATMEFDTRESFMGWMKSDAFRSAHAGTESGGETGGQVPSSVESFTIVEDVRA